MVDGPETQRADATRTDAARRNNPMNRLVPYLDLFMRLDDGELSRLAGVDLDLVATLRRQVVEIGEGLAQYIDLLPRLSDEELVRLTGASAKTVRFWRLCQPRNSPARAADMAARAEISSITPMPRPVQPAAREAPPPREAPAPAEPRRRRTTGVGTQPTMVAGGAADSQSQPVASWTHETSATNAATMVTPAPHQVPSGRAPRPAAASSSVEPAAAWDTTSPTSGTATMVTPIGQTPGVMWGDPETPSDTATLPAGAQPRAAGSSPALALDINGEPFPGYERFQGGRTAPPDDDAAFELADLDS